MTKYYIKHIHMPHEEAQWMGALSSEEIYPLSHAKTVNQAMKDAQEWIDYHDPSPDDYVLLLDDKLRSIKIIKKPDDVFLP